MKNPCVFLATTLLLFLSVYPEPVYACSGGGSTPLITLLNEASIVVKARVLDADAYGQTGVIEVSEFLVGSADANRLLVIQSDPVRTTSLLENRGGSGGCATLAPSLTPDEEVYLFLAHDTDGTYRPSVVPNQFSYSTMAYRFPQENSTALLVTGEAGDANTPGTLEAQLVSETEFREIVLEYSQSTPRSPNADSTYPSPASILLTTTEGYYLLPPDQSHPQHLSEQDISSLRRSPSVWRRNNPPGVTGCSVIGCTAYSPSGLDQASVTSDDIILNGSLIEGKAFLFSFTSELIAVWNHDVLDFYAFRYPKLGTEEFGNTLLTSHPIRNGSDWLGKAAWSQDGRLFAYTDVEGLWLLDVYSQYSHLVVPAQDTQSTAWARYFSAGGRYLAITEGDGGERYNLDLITGELLPDGVFSPNERFLIAYDTYSRISTYSQCILTSPYPCSEIALGREVFWLDSNQYVLSRCGSSDATVCSTGASSVSCCSGLFLGDNLAMDYEPVTGAYLVVRSDQQIEVWDGYHTINHELQGLIEGEIINAEWLPSLYQGNRTFSDIVIQRYLDYLELLPSA